MWINANDGSYVVSWTSVNQDGTSNIYARSTTLGATR